MSENKQTITVVIKCCVVDVTTKNRKHVLAEHLPISVGYNWQGNFKYYFGLDCIKRFASGLLELETRNNFQPNE